MSPTPKRQPMVTCPNCGALNDPARGSKYCFSCNMPLSKATGLQVFDVEGSGWRFGQDGDGTPWAVAADVAKSFDHSNTTVMLRMLEDDEKGLREVYTPGGRQELNVVLEDGIWELIFRSTKPQAKAIKKRVKAILREIRETGSYQAAPAHPLPRTFSQALRELADAVEQRDAAEQRITELQPAADAWEKLADAKGDYSVRDAAQILSRDPLITTGQNRLFAYMRHIGWLDKSGTPYQTQVDLGRILPLATSYSHPSTGDRMASSQVRVTPKGLKELRSRLAGQQQLVVIEGGA